MPSELRSILEAYARSSAERLACALATVVNVEGSSYRRPGARMLLTDDGQVIGCVSGGCLERDLLHRRDLLRAEAVSPAGVLLRYDSREDLPDGESAPGASLGCNGLVDIWLEMLPADGTHAALNQLAQCLRDRKPGTVTVTDLAGKTLLVQDFKPPVPWLLFGAGIDALPMVRLASELGWETTVVDCRSSLPVPRMRFTELDVHYVQARPEDACAKVAVTSETCAIVMTHNYDHDLEILARLIESPARYIGVLGPRKRALRLLEELQRRGQVISAEQLSRLHAPVGLDLGAETPQEIALSVVAEVRAEIAGRTPMPLRERSGPIHERAFADPRKGADAGVVAYLLAAGESRRMGRPKQLLPWKGKSLVTHAAVEIAQAIRGPVRVVRGAHAQAITDAFDGDAHGDAEVTFVDNPHWQTGPGSSVKAAITHARMTGAPAALIVACDQPFLDAASYRKLLEKFFERPRIVAATYAGTVGIPAIFPASCFDELLAIADDSGAKRVLEAHREASDLPGESTRSELVMVALPEAARDLDSPSDYESALLVE